MAEQVVAVLFAVRDGAPLYPDGRDMKSSMTRALGDLGLPRTPTNLASILRAQDWLQRVVIKIQAA